MGVIEFFILCLVLVVLCYLFTLGMAKLAPDHPKIIDYIMWGVVVIIIIYTLISATGLLNFDPRIPRVH